MTCQGGPGEWAGERREEKKLLEELGLVLPSWLNALLFSSLSILLDPPGKPSDWLKLKCVQGERLWYGTHPAVVRNLRRLLLDMKVSGAVYLEHGLCKCEQGVAGDDRMCCQCGRVLQPF